MQQHKGNGNGMRTYHAADLSRDLFKKIMSGREHCHFVSFWAGQDSFGWEAVEAGDIQETDMPS